MRYNLPQLYAETYPHRIFPFAPFDAFLYGQNEGAEQEKLAGSGGAIRGC
jgi:hypothetical protein